jgi:hypothetical protein
MHNTSIPLGEIRGRAVVRDKDGNVKGEFEFGGPATQDQFGKLKEATENGSHTGDSSAERGS